MDPKLKESIDNLNKNIQKSNSFWLSLLKGIFSGLGFAIGSIILFAIVLYSISRTPVVGQFIADILEEIRKYR